MGTHAAVRILAGAVLYTATVLSQSCAPRGQKAAVPVTVRPATDTAGVKAEAESASVAAKLDTIVGTIRRVDLEGGFWGLFSDDGQRYDPTGSLPRAAQQEGARVRVIAAKRTGVSTFRMWGTVIDVVSYEQLGDTVK
jgi:hypothetical protein